MVSQKKQQFDNLKFPPAMETVFDVSVIEDKAFDIDQLKTDEKSFRKKMPVMENMHLFEGMFDSNATVSTSKRHIGFMYKSADGKEIAQFRRNGFAYNKLGDYPGWDSFSKNALKYLKIYQSLYQKSTIVRLGLRFINLISIDGYRDNVGDYFNVSLTPNKIQAPKEFQYQYVTEFKKLECQARVILGLTARADGEATKFLFDIDVSQTRESFTSNRAYLKAVFDNLREAKNIIFFSTLTKKALEPYR